MIYINDFIAILQSLADLRQSAIFNVGADEEYTIRQFAKMICEEVGYPSKRLSFDTGRYVGVKSKCLFGREEPGRPWATTTRMTWRAAS